MGELKSDELALDWDACKINIQSITRAFKRQKRPESEIARLNRRLKVLKTQHVRAKRKGHLQIQIGELEDKMKVKVARLAEKWGVKAKAR